MVKQGFIAGGLLLALVLGLLWRASALAQGEMGNSAPLAYLISTQAASSSTSLQFTSLPTNYNRLLLHCNALLVSSSGGCIELLVGESGG